MLVWDEINDLIINDILPVMIALLLALVTVGTIGYAILTSSTPTIYEKVDEISKKEIR